MLVECIRITDSTGAIVSNSPWLTVGKCYHVLSVYVSCKGPVEYRIVADDNMTPGMYRAEQFAILEGALAENWIANFEPGSYFELAPKSWTVPGFWESYFDREPHAVSQFEIEKEKIEKTELKGPPISRP